MSSFRPTLTDSNKPGLSYRSTYFRVLESTALVRKLVHGRLYDNGNSCAIGTYFRNQDIPIDSLAIDEIAAYNDSFKNLSQHDRWRKVRKWLKFQVAQFNRK